jgi:hypothetical protein
MTPWAGTATAEKSAQKHTPSITARSLILIYSLPKMFNADSFQSVGQLENEWGCSGLQKTFCNKSP